MLNLITNEEMRQADMFTCSHFQIDSIDLMEQAASAFTDIFVNEVSVERNITIIAGTGNNGGDGLAVARLLRIKGYRSIQIICLNAFSKESKDFKINKDRICALKIPFKTVSKVDQLPSNFDVVIDAVLGSGFTRDLSPFLKESFCHINSNSRFIISVDVPSGCAAEDFTLKKYEGIRSHLTITFQRPKLLFTLPESYAVTRSFKFASIGLSEEYLKSIPSDYFWIDEATIKGLLHKREAFTHKGVYGHALVFSGSDQTKGATLLAGKSALFTGVGLVTLLIEERYFPYINIFQPEFMTFKKEYITDLDYSKFQCIAAGPGMGTDADVKQKLLFLLKQKRSMVLDADALNLLTIDLLKQNISQPIVLTPHVKEFDRLFGAHNSWYSRLQTARKYARQLKCVIVLKNQYTYIFNEEGKVFINSTGNPSMAQGGMGDVLTGCITGFLTRGYSAFHAAVLGCFVHGKAGDDLATSYEVTTASFVAEQIPLTIKKILTASSGS